VCPSLASYHFGLSTTHTSTNASIKANTNINASTKVNASINANAETNTDTHTSASHALFRRQPLDPGTQN